MIDKIFAWLGYVPSCEYFAMMDMKNMFKDQCEIMDKEIGKLKLACVDKQEDYNNLLEDIKNQNVVLETYKFQVANYQGKYHQLKNTNLYRVGYEQGKEAGILEGLIQ